MAVNEPSPRAKPEDKARFVKLRCHKPLATHAITVIISHLINFNCGTHMIHCHTLCLKQVLKLITNECKLLTSN